MADKVLSRQEKERLKEKDKFERERKKWKKQESKKRTKKSRKVDSGSVLFKTLAVVLAVAVVLGLGSIYAGSYNIPGRFMPALTVGEANVDAPAWAFSFYFAYRQMYQYGMYLGLDTSISAFGQPSPYSTNGEEDGPKMTWDEYFRKQVNSSLQNEFALYSEAQKAGFKLDKAAQDELTALMEDLKTQATSSAMSESAYLRHSYSAGLTKAKYRNLQERMLVVQGFTDQKKAEFRTNHGEAELKAEYEKDPSLFKQVDYRVYTFAKEALTANEGENADALAARQKEADAAAKKSAEDFLAKAGTQESFIAAAKAQYDEKHQHEEGEEVDHAHDYDADASTLSLRKKLADLSNAYEDEKFAAWFFEGARKAGDTTLCETDKNIYVVLMTRTAYEQTTVNFYTINVAAAEIEGEPAEGVPSADEQAWDRAQSLMEKWHDRGATEEAFAALVKAQPGADEEPEDAKPGLTEKAAPGTHTELDGWLFNPARKAGDAEVVSTESGYTVIYLASQNTTDFVWKTEIANSFADEDYSAYVTELKKEYPLGHHGIGMRFAIKDAQKMCDAYMEYAAASQNNGAQYIV